VLDTDTALTELATVDALPILLVDDRPENLRTLETVLAPLGYPIETASSGNEALRLLLARDFALILLDVRMPGLDGLETARLIKGRARTRDIPIVFLTAAKDELGDMIRGYGVGAIDYVLKPVDPELLRSKVAVFAELERSRRALKQSEAFLRAAFEAAPIGKTMLDGERRIVRSNPAFARLVGRDPDDLRGVAIADLFREEDRGGLSEALERVARGEPGQAAPDRAGVDLRLARTSGSEVWVALVASSIEQSELGEPLLLAQWIDLTARRRAEQARAELLVEQAARSHAESIAERLRRLEAFSGAIEALTLDELLPELAARISEIFDAELVEVEIGDGTERPMVVRAAGGTAHVLTNDDRRAAREDWLETALGIEGTNLGTLRVALAPQQIMSAADRALLFDVAQRATLSIRRGQLHEQEHRIALELQRGLLPKALPEVEGLELAAHYQAAGLGAEAGGDWYDAFTLPGGRVGVVVGDVAGKGVYAASAMGQLRSVTRAFALAEDGTRMPGEVLTLLNRHQLALGLEDLFTVVYAIVDPRLRTLSWANAGHPPPLLRAGGRARVLEGGEGLTGIEELIYADLHESLERGAILILYSDGLVERRGESLDDGLRRLADAAIRGPGEPAALRDHVLREVLPAEGLADDVTLLIARVP
jgi:PAS domain S-box-containing protein